MEQTPFMKAMYAFARADPDDCLQEWAAVLALVSNDETASDSSPKNSTSSLAPAVVSASSTERSTVSLHAPSSATSNPTMPDASRAVLDAQRDSSKDDLTPGARRIYDLLDGGSVAPTSSSAVPPGDHEAAAATSTTASPLDVLRAHSTSGAISTRAATATCVPRVIPLDSTPTLVPAGTAAPEWNLHSLTPSNCSTICPAGDTSATTTPASSTTVSSMLSSPAEIEDIQDAVDFGVVDLVASAPTTCSAERPSHAVSVYTAALIPSATPNTSTTTGGIVPELAAPELSDKELYVDVMGDTVQLAAICLPGGPDPSTGREDTMSMSLTLWSAPTSFTAFPGNSTSPWLASLDVVQPFMWSPITCSTIHSSCCIDMPPSLLHEQQKRAKDSSVQDSKGIWNEIWLDVELKPPWPSLGYPSSNGFPAILNGEAVVHQSSICTLVLAVNVRTGWIYHHILQGNTHYSEQMQWSFSDSLLVSECWFCTPGHILLFCCALVQLEKSWTLSPIPLKSWFQFCRAGDESVYSSESFQWTIAWPIRYHFSLSVLQTLPRCAILLIHKNCPATNQEIGFRLMIAKLIRAAVLVRFLETCSEAVLELCMVNYAQPYSSECSQWEIAWMVRWSSGAQSDFACSGIFTIRFWLNFKLGKLPRLCCRDLNFWRYPSVDPIMPNSACIFRCGFELTQWKIAWSKEQTMNLLTRNYREGFLVVLTMASNALVLIIGCKNRCMGCSAWTEDIVPTQLLEVYNMLSRQDRSGIPLELFVMEHWFISWDPGNVPVQHWRPYLQLIPWEPRNDSPGHNLKGNFTSLSVACDLVYSVSGADMLLATRSLLWCVRCVQFDTDGPRNCVVFLQPKPPWSDVAPTNSVDVADSLRIAGVSMEFKQFGPFASHGRRLSQGWILYLPVTCIVQCGSELMPWENAKSRYANWTYTKQVLISWESVPVLDAATDVNCNSTPLLSLKLTWDPGGYRQHPLEGKPDFKEGGLSTTCLQELSHGLPHWAVACLAARYEDREAYIPKERPHQDSAWNRTERAASAEARVACALFFFFLLDPSFLSKVHLRSIL